MERIRTRAASRIAERASTRRNIVYLSVGLARGLEPQHGTVRLTAAVRRLGRQIQIAVRPLLHVADAHAELGEHRLPLLGLSAGAAARASNDHALELLGGERADE